MRSSFFQCDIYNLPMKLARLRLKDVPIPAAIRDGALRKIRFRGRLRQLRDGPGFGPLQWRIRRLAVEPLKSRNAHSGIYQYVVNFFRSDDDDVRLCNSLIPRRQCQKNPETTISGDHDRPCAAVCAKP